MSLEIVKINDALSGCYYGPTIALLACYRLAGRDLVGRNADAKNQVQR